ncbi:MAG: MarR family winged helix-turn-helix transcriptional regulator [Acidimicrobiales bacterium]
MKPTKATMDQILTSLQIVTRTSSQVRAHEQLLHAAGVRLDRAGFTLLYKFWLHEDSTFRVTSLAGLLGVDVPTVTRKVQQLERLGYLAREADPDDGRATRLRLTESGQQTLDRILVAHRERLGRLFDKWDDDDVRKFASLLEQFSESMQHDMGATNDN